MSTPIPPPVVNNGTARVWTCARDPMSSEPDAFIEALNFWFNTVTYSLFMCVNADNDQQLLWREVSLFSPEDFI